MKYLITALLLFMACTPTSESTEPDITGQWCNVDNLNECIEVTSYTIHGERIDGTIYGVFESGGFYGPTNFYLKGDTLTEFHDYFFVVNVRK